VISAFYLYHPSGQLYVVGQKNEYTEVVGDFKAYYRNGYIYISGKSSEDGKRIGEWKFFNRKGRIVKIEVYESAKVVKVKKYKWSSLFKRKGERIGPCSKSARKIQEDSGTGLYCHRTFMF